MRCLFFKGFHAFLMVLKVTGSLGQFTLFALTVIDERLDRSYQAADTDAQLNERKYDRENILNNCHSRIAPLNQLRKSSLALAAKSDSALTLPPSGSLVWISWRLFSPQEMPLLQFLLKA